MITCPQCNKELADGARFCDACGTKMPETIFCSACGQQTSTEFAFCQSCGASLAVEEVPVQEEAVQEEPVQYAEPEVQATNKFDISKLLAKLPFKLDEKVAKLGAIALAGILVVVMIISLISGAVNKNNAVFYKKDGELMFSKLSKSKTWEVEEDGRSPVLSKDGKKIFYLNDENTLYYRSATNAKKEPVKIASDVNSYIVNEKANRVTYHKNDNLYQSNLKESEKIASDVDVYSWTVSDNGKNVIFIDDEETAFFVTVGKDKIKIDKNISVQHVAEDCKTVWYTKDNTLYKKQMKKDKVKIASDVYSVEQVYESGEIYFLTSDDLDDEDYGYYYSTPECDLCYYTGKKVVSLAKNVTSSVSASAADEKATAIYQVYEGSDDDKEEGQVYVAVGKKTSKINLDDIYSYGLSTDGKNAWVLNDVSDSEGDLYKVKISGGKAKKPAKISGDVYSSYINFIEDKIAYFTDVETKDSSENDYDYDYDYDDYDYDDYDYDYYSTPTEGTLNIDKKKVEDDVQLTWLYYDEDAKGAFYQTDVDKEDDTYTLNLLKGTKGRKIAEDVNDYIVTGGGKIIYLGDWDAEDGEGTLYLYKKSKPKQIDDEVTMLYQIQTWD